MPPQLEENHVVPTAWQDEALARDGVSRDVPCSALKGETQIVSNQLFPVLQLLSHRSRVQFGFVPLATYIYSIAYVRDLFNNICEGLRKTSVVSGCGPPLGKELRLLLTFTFTVMLQHSSSKRPNLFIIN